MSADRRAACAAVSSSVWSVHGRQPRAWAVSEIAVRSDDSEPGGLWRAIAGSNSATPAGSWRQLRSLAGERRPLLRRRQFAAQQQVPGVLDPTAAGDIDGVVAAVVVEAEPPEHVGNLRPGHRHPGQPGGCLVWSADNVC